MCRCWPCLWASLWMAGCSVAVATGDDPVVVGGKAPGQRCVCDVECGSVEGHDGVCVRGVCMSRASASCPGPGRTEPCPTGSRCWQLEGVPPEDAAICWPDCDTYSCLGLCDMDGSCSWTWYTDCDPGCGLACSEPTAACDRDGDCDPGDRCVDGRCVLDLGAGPGPAGDATCDLPPSRCAGDEAHCGELVQFEPTEGRGYVDYRVNGEGPEQYRSWLRRDAVVAVQYAAAVVDCIAAEWDTGNGAPIGLVDMSERDGSIPGTAVGAPGHPVGTHTDGHDIDVAYYQDGTGDNAPRAVCEHRENGLDVYHCVEEPTLLDPWRTALFIGALAEHGALRLVGVDGRIGPKVDSAMATLCADGWLDPIACFGSPLGWEEEDEGHGLFRFHHHHMHVSFHDATYAQE